MSLNPIKAKWVITTRQNRQNIFAKLPNLLVEKELIEIVDSHRVLRVVTDNNLIWHDHVNSLTKKSLEKCASTVQSQKLPKFVCRKIFLHAHIISVISYGSTLFDSAREKAMKPLLSVYNRAVKAVLLKSTIEVSLDYADLKILPIKKVICFKQGHTYEKKTHGWKCPTDPQTKFQPTPRETDKLQVPVPRTDQFKSRVLYSGRVLWNTLSPTSRSIMALS